MRKEGIIIGKDQEHIEVMVLRQKGCGENCASCSSCDDTEIIRARKNFDVEIGDKVHVTAESQSVLSYILILYGIPLGLLIAGILISHSYFTIKNIEPVEIYSFIVGIIAFTASAFFIKRLDDHFKKREEFLKIEKI